MANKKKKNEFKMQETKEMVLPEVEKSKPVNDEKPPLPFSREDFDRLVTEFPHQDKKVIETMLKEMHVNDVTYILSEEESFRVEEEVKSELKVETEVEKPKQNINPKQEVEKMTDENQTEENIITMTAEQEFEALMAEQNKMQKSMESKKGGVTSVDDTVERADRATQITEDGKRKGKAYKPRKGTSLFMARQNAKYKSSGKPAPYSEKCIFNTIKRERA